MSLKGQTAPSSLVLVVDDNPINIHFIELFLGNHGFQTASLDNGKEIVNWVLEHKPDLILLDIMMPQVNGIEACKTLKSHPATSSIPIIFLTAKAGTESLAEGFNAGAADYVVKPFDSNELLARVKAHVHIYQLQKDLLDKNQKLEDSLNQIAKLKHAMIKVCAWTKQIKVNDEWVSMDEYLSKHLGLQITHGLSEDGAKILMSEASLPDSQSST